MKITNILDTLCLDISIFTNFVLYMKKIVIIKKSYNFFFYFHFDTHTHRRVRPNNNYSNNNNDNDIDNRNLKHTTAVRHKLTRGHNVCTYDQYTELPTKDTLTHPKLLLHIPYCYSHVIRFS